MPVGKKFDFMLKDKGYLLARPTKSLARAWQRSGVPDSPAVEQPRLASEYGGLPGTVEFPEIWNDWAGGFGHAYRHPKDENSYFGFLSNPNTYHWSENFDPRFGRQLVHAQALLSVSTSGGEDHGIESMLNIPAGTVNIKPGGGTVLVLKNLALNRKIETYTPTESVSAPFDKRQLRSTSDLGGLGRKPAIFGSYIYAPVISGSFWQIDMNGALQCIADLPGAAFAVAGSRLWRAHGPNNDAPVYLQNCADTSQSGPLVASGWSATINIGDSFQPILDMVSLDDQLFVGKPDGLYAGDSGGSFFNVLSELSTQIHKDNCRDLTIHNHQVIAQHSAGIFAYSPTSTTTARARQIGPQSLSIKSPVHGKFRCVRALGEWLYAGLYTGSYSYIMAGWDEGNGQGAYTWHTMQRLPHTTKVHRLLVDGITAGSSGKAIPNHMWVATDASIDTSGTSMLYAIPMPALNDNPLLPDVGFSANYTNSARMDFGQTDGRTPTTPKIYRQAEVWADNLDGSQRWGLLYYTLNGGGTRTLLGTFNSSPKSVLYFPTGDGNFVMAQSIELSLESYIAAGAEATTPVYRSIILRQTQTPRSVDVITAIADLGDGMVDRQGALMRPGAVQIQELRDMAGSQPVQLTDVLGNTSWVKIQQPVEEQEQWQEGMQAPSVLATIRLSVMNFSGP